MRSGRLMLFLSVAVLTACGELETVGGGSGGAGTSTPTGNKAQASCENVAYDGSSTPRIAYMPPATEFPYYLAIGEGIKAKASEVNAETFMLAPQSGADIEGQIGMLQDVLTQGVDGIILSTHDEKAAAPLVRQAVDSGIALVIVNSDIADFPTPVHGVVGYQQRKGTNKIGDYAIEMVDGQAKIGVIEGLPGYHSKERVGGFLDAIEGEQGMDVVESLPGDWNVEGGNRAGMDMLQAHPEINMIFAANDYMAIGANKAAEDLGHDVIVLGNDGDTQALEEIYAGEWEATVNTTPFEMGETVLDVMMDCLNKEFTGFYIETPTQIVDETNVIQYLCQEDRLYPPPSKDYEC
jgi:ribose transport system substrate-binding protein